MARERAVAEALLAIAAAAVTADVVAVATDVVAAAAATAVDVAVEDNVRNLWGRLGRERVWPPLKSLEEEFAKGQTSPSFVVLNQRQRGPK